MLGKDAFDWIGPFISARRSDTGFRGLELSWRCVDPQLVKKINGDVAAAEDGRICKCPLTQTSPAFGIVVEIK